MQPQELQHQDDPVAQFQGEIDCFLVKLDAFELLVGEYYSSEIRCKLKELKHYKGERSKILSKDLKPEMTKEAYLALLQETKDLDKCMLTIKAEAEVFSGLRESVLANYS